MSSIANIMNSYSNNIEVIKISPTAHQRVKFVDLLKKNQLAFKVRQIVKKTVFYLFQCSITFIFELE